MTLPEVFYSERIYLANGGKEIHYRYKCENRYDGKPHVTIYDNYEDFPGTIDYLTEIATQVLQGTGVSLDEVTWSLSTISYGHKSDISFSCIDGQPYKVSVSDPRAIGMSPKEGQPVKAYLLHDDRNWAGPRKEYLPCQTLFNDISRSSVFLADTFMVLNDIMANGGRMRRSLSQEWKSRTSLHSPFAVGCWGMRNGHVAMVSPKEEVLRVLASTQTPFFPMGTYGDDPATFETLKRQYGYGYDADGTGPDMSFK